MVDVYTFMYDGVIALMHPEWEFSCRTVRSYRVAMHSRNFIIGNVILITDFFRRPNALI